MQWTEREQEGDAEVPDVIIYLGPSLPLHEAEVILPAGESVCYLPPIRRGDLAQAISSRPKIIGIIDGLFFENAAVGHREILSAIRAGIRVIGGSSMGALRAAELHPFGMEGVGEVFARYRDGLIESDDEVALICDPETNIALSEVLINIRITLEKGRDSNVIAEDEYASLLAAAKGVYYPERTWSLVIRNGIPSSDRRKDIQDWIKESAVDQKKEDAKKVLKYIIDIWMKEELGSP